MSEIINAQKKALRLTIAAMGSERPGGSETLSEILLASREYRNAKRILAFYGVGAEPDTTLIMERVIHDGKLLCLPLCINDTVMEARAVRSLSGLVPGRYGIPEPPPDSDALPPDSLDLVLVPGLYFDKSGYRLGHGAGYYDRYLPACLCYTIGLCFESRLIDRVPHSTNDTPVGAIVTDKRFIVISKTETHHD